MKRTALCHVWCWRRVRHLACASLVAVAAVLGGCQSDETERVWGTYQEPVAPQELPPATGAPELVEVWERKLGAGAERGYAIFKPRYARGGLYVANRERVHKLNPANGEDIWVREFERAIFSGVSADNSLAAVALEDGTIVALDADSGETLWETPLLRQISAIPAVGAGRVIARTAGGRVVGIDARDGEIAWSYERAVPGLSVHGDSKPVIDGNAVFIGLPNGRLLVGDAISGREYWETEVSFARGRNELERLTDSDSSPLVAGDTVYAATFQGNVVALRVPTAEVQWKANISSRLPMSLGDGSLLVTNDLGEIIALDTDFGQPRWTQTAFRGHGMSRPLVVRNRVVVGDAAGNVYSLDLADGALLENRERAVKGAVVALIPGRNQFAVFSSEGHLRVLSLPN